MDEICITITFFREIEEKWEETDENRRLLGLDRERKRRKKRVQNCLERKQKGLIGF